MTADNQNPWLFEGLPDFSDADTDATSLLPLAASLRDAVQRRLNLAADAEPTPSPSIDTIFDNALQDIMGELLDDRIARLTPVQFAEAYERANGKDELLLALEAIKAVKANQLAREALLLTLRHEGETSGRINVGHLPQDSVLTIGLCDPALPQLANKRSSDSAEKRPLHRLWKLRLLEPETGHVETIYDNWVGAPWSRNLQTESLEPFSRGSIGALRLGQPVSKLEPVITHYAPLSIVAEDGTVLQRPQIVGFVDIDNDATILG